MTVLLDGGMGEELRERGVNTDARVAGRALLEAPAAVRDAHRQFVAAGAEVITTWNYTVTPQRLTLFGVRDSFEEMTRASVALADEARAGKAGVRLAGSLPPLRASYEPNDQDVASMMEEYAEIAALLAPGVDLFICETMSSASEAAAAACAAAAHDKPVWVSWTLRDENDGRLRSGETVEAALAALADIRVDALLFNCCDARVITDTLPRLRALTELPIGAYANAFVPIARDWKRDGYRLRDRHELIPHDYGNLAARWLTAGAGIVGGCCGIGPAHIAHLREVLSRRG